RLRPRRDALLGQARPAGIARSGGDARPRRGPRRMSPHPRATARARPLDVASSYDERPDDPATRRTGGQATVCYESSGPPAARRAEDQATVCYRERLAWRERQRPPRRTLAETGV